MITLKSLLNTLGTTLKKQQPKKLKLHFTNCATLPLWNFFQVVEHGDFKFLFVCTRADYSGLTVHPSNEQQLADVWDGIVDEYGQLNKSTAINTYNTVKQKQLYRWAIYIEEQAMIKTLLLTTHVPYVRELIKRGYKLDTRTQEGYWNSLIAASKRVHHHISTLESLALRLEDKNKEPYTNPYDHIMAWLMTHGIAIDENLTVKRYVELRNVITEKIKIQNEQVKKNNRGRARA